MSSSTNGQVSTWLIRVGMAAAANAIALLVAAMIFDKMEINVVTFIVAVAIFTLAAIAIKPLAEKAAGKYASGVTWVAGLATTFLALLITDILTEGLEIEGAFTWIGGTIVVWLGTVLYDLVDDTLIANVTNRLSGPHQAPS